MLPDKPNEEIEGGGGPSSERKFSNRGTGIARFKRGLQRKFHTEATSAALLAGHMNFASVSYTDRFHNRQSQTSPAGSAGACLIDSIETLEDVWNRVLRYAHAVVRYFKDGVRATA